MGSVIIAPLNDSERDSTQSSTVRDRYMVIPFQNEYLYAALSDARGSEESQEVVCTVPISFRFWARTARESGPRTFGTASVSM
jgi:hypothetical protein